MVVATSYILMPNDGIYLEVEKGKRLVFTDGYSEGRKPAADPFMTAIEVAYLDFHQVN